MQAYIEKMSAPCTHSRHLRCRMLVLLVPIFLAWIISSRPTMAQINRTERVSPCKASQLAAIQDIKQSDQVAAGLGRHAMTIALQNRSSSPCVLKGVPTLTLSDTANHPLPLRVCLNCGDYLFRSQPAKEIPLRPGGLAYVVIGYGINNGNGQWQCREAASLSLHLQGNQEPLAFRVAGMRSCGPVDITPFLGNAPVEGFLPNLGRANREN